MDHTTSDESIWEHQLAPQSNIFWMKTFDSSLGPSGPHLMPIWPPRPPPPTVQPKTIPSFELSHSSLDLLDFFHLLRLFGPSPSSLLPPEFLNRPSAPTSRRQTNVPPRACLSVRADCADPAPRRFPTSVLEERRIAGGGTNISALICWCFSPSDSFHLFSRFSQPERLSRNDLPRPLLRTWRVLHEEIFVTALLHVLLLAQTASVFFSRLVGSQKQPQVIYSGFKWREDPGAGGRGPELRGMRGLSRNAAPPRQEWLQPQELTPLLFTSHLNVLEVFYSQLRQLHSRLVKATRRFRRRRSNDLFHLIKQQVGEEPAEK